MQVATTVPAFDSHTSIRDLIERSGLSSVYQPIFDLQSAEILGYEGLIRGPSGTPFASPAALFERARAEQCEVFLEYAAARHCLEGFLATGAPGKLFINLSADALSQIASQWHWFQSNFQRAGIGADRLVFELTEQSPVRDLDLLLDAIAWVRETGARFALDDYGMANASMHLWVAARPDIVKIDRFFIHGIAQDPMKFEAVKAMQCFASASGALLIAEGIEATEDIVVVRDMGINAGQGFLLGRPAATVSAEPTFAAHEALSVRRIAIFPEPSRQSPATSGGAAAAKLAVKAPTVSSRTTNNEVFQLFKEDPAITAVAVVENSKAIALINRRSFMDRYALPYQRELQGKKSCMALANTAPIIVDKAMSIEQMAKQLSSDERYLADGFIVTENGEYAGIGEGEDFVRTVTDVRIEAARYANPLTFLPGNVPISSHIERLLQRGAEFTACYVDLNNFKPFNDHYGYWQGDEVLKCAAAVLTDNIDPGCDFLGHVGGDDFLVLFQSVDWEIRAVRAIQAFNHSVTRFYSAADRLAGGIQAQDRYGAMRRFGFVTMASGCVRIEPTAGRHRLFSEEVASMASVAKSRAKQAPSGFAIIKPIGGGRDRGLIPRAG